MKKHIFSLIACFLLTACIEQASNAGIGFGMAGYSSRYIKMDIQARHVIHDYLASTYAQNCGGKKAKRHPEACRQDRPFLTSGSMPVGAKYDPLPQDIVNKIAFTPPGSVFVQSGYNVYLIRWTDKIIYDSVSLHPYWKESLRK